MDKHGRDKILQTETENHTKFIYDEDSLAVESGLKQSIVDKFVRSISIATLIDAL